MIEGEFRLQKSGVDWLLWGAGWSNLCFRPGGEAKAEIEMTTDVERPGFRCSECETLVVKPIAYKWVKDSRVP